jgi:autotransporter translocation and assembly factor TamB
MKPTFLAFVALALTPWIATAKSHKSQSKGKPATTMKAEADAINFSVKDANKSTKNYRLEVPATAGKQEDLPFKVSDTVAALAALNWASGFYNATNLAANSVEHKVSSVQFPYYLVNMTGTVGGLAQPLYAVVLENGELVRPVLR